MPDTLKHAIKAQRALLKELLGSKLSEYANKLPPLLVDAEALDKHLSEIFPLFEYSKYVYVLGSDAIQISSTFNRYGADIESRGRDRSKRPYMQHMYDENIDFSLSQAYISRNKKRPSLTAVQTIRDENGKRLGFLGVDYDLRELPHSEVIYEEPSQWRQIKGDPAIRGGLFLQERVESLMDRHIDDVLSLHESLMIDQGVHHIQMHFSSSRSTVWHIDDPYVYHILSIEELTNPNICLAYPRRPYFERAIVPPSHIAKVLKQFRALRFADETIYLRAGALNIVNGKVGLNFSCDGTHYVNYDEFLERGLEFWFGEEQFPQAVLPAVELDYQKLDNKVEELAEQGCLQVNKLLFRMEKDEVPEVLQDYSKAELDYVYKELKSVMDVYDGDVCEL